MTDRSVGKWTTLALVLGLFAGTPVRPLGAEKEAAKTYGAVLSVSTDPVGAEVFVDGRFEGNTPMTLRKLTPGDHRVRVAKEGFLENSRVLAVSGNSPRAVHVQLTPNRQQTPVSASRAASQLQGSGRQGGGGIFSNPWFWTAVAGAGGGAAYMVLTKNSPPTAGTISVSPTGTGMAAITTFTFSAQGARDPDGDPLTYSWRFSDNSTASGASVNKVFGQGTIEASLTVSDGKKSAAASAVSVTIGPNFVGTWTGGRENFFGCAINWVLTQSGGAISGSMAFAGGCTGTITGVTGTVSPLTHPASVSWQAPSYVFTNSAGTSFANQLMSFTGTTNATGTAITGSLRLRQSPGTFDQSYAATYVK